MIGFAEDALKDEIVF